MSSKEKLKVVLFSGGRGTATITDALLQYPNIELVSLVNAYDDGKSTGLLRRFIPGMLGPSDIRKVVSVLLKHEPDRSSQALRELMEYRMPDEITTKEALNLLDDFVAWDKVTNSSHPVLKAKEQLALGQLRLASQYLQAFLDYYHGAQNKGDFTFADNSLGNLFFAGCYLLGGQSFNKAIELYCDFAEVGQGVVNITQGENLALVGVKEDGRFLNDEASVQGPQDALPIEEIFLLPDYRGPVTLESRHNKESLISTLRSQESLPRINSVADKALRQADIIIYGPGTQYSSLYPSYMTIGVAEAIAANKKAEKIFIANIARDADILTENATTLIDEFLWSMSRKETIVIQGRQFITRFFFQKPENASQSSEYLPFEASEFPYPLEKVMWLDWEGAKGKHLGSRIVSELLYIVEAKLQQKVPHVPHKVSIIVPALNEERTIKQVLRDLRLLQLPSTGLDKEIIVIDGGSSDKTYYIASKEPDIRTYQLAGTSGRGAALKLGLEKAKGEIIVFFPSDGEYFVDDIPRIVEPLLTQEFPVVFGSRAFGTNDLSGTLQRIYGNKGLAFRISKYGGMLLTTLTLLIYQRYVSDTFTSIKGFQSRVFRNMQFTRDGVEFDMELIAKMAKAGYSILEVPVNYKARTVQEGKKVTVWDGIKSLGALLRLATYKHVKKTAQKTASKAVVTKETKKVASPRLKKA